MSKLDCVDADKNILLLTSMNIIQNYFCTSEIISYNSVTIKKMITQILFHFVKMVVLIVSIFSDHQQSLESHQHFISSY